MDKSAWKVYDDYKFTKEGNIKNMNKQEWDILLQIRKNGYENQRLLAESSGRSLGIVNRSVNALMAQGYLNEQMEPTVAADRMLEARKPRNAVILAAGYGMRMVPVNSETPKGLLEVSGEALVERVIRQLQEVGISEIYLVTGFMKEAYEYLIDKYHVKFIVNTEYSVKNNLHSLALAAPYLSNTYVIPCDIWCKENPFCEQEAYSWYMVTDALKNESSVRVNRKEELVCLKKTSDDGNAMIGIAYLLEEQSQRLIQKLEQMDGNGRFAQAFWEDALYENDKMPLYAKVVPAAGVVEINTYEELRELDSHSRHLEANAVKEAASVLRVRPEDIHSIEVLKKGMTNRSFSFVCGDKKYVMRVPGEGTGQMIDRLQEAAVYEVIRGKGLCEDPIYINPENGYKIARFLENYRACDPLDENDLRRCMQKLRNFHSMKLAAGHDFDLFGQIEFYESLWKEKKSIYRDYQETKENVFSLKDYIQKYAGGKVLTHIDAVPDNFLFVKDARSGEEEIQLIDWEYAGMQDPHVDIAMFCIYAMYDRCQIDRLIDIYFEPDGCAGETRTKIYCYIAVCGLLWSNWCEYKRGLGVNFGEYSLWQYRYAKEYYRIVKGLIGD